MQNNGPFQPGQPGYGEPIDPNQGSQDPSQQPPHQPGRRVIEQPYGPPIIIEEPSVSPPPLAQTIRANSQPQAAPPPFTPLNQPVQSPPPQAPVPGYGAPYQASPQQQPFQQNYQTQVPPQSYPPTPAQGYPPYQTAPVAPGNFPPGAYSGGSFPPSGYPPQGGPRRSGVPTWALIAGGVVVVLVLLGIIGALTRGPTPTPTIRVTSTPTTPKSTSIPALSGTMKLGNDYTQDSNSDFVISDETDTFSSSDQFAYVITLNKGVGTLQATLILASVSGGVETVVSSNPINISDPTFDEFANRFATTTLMGSAQAGNYILKFAVNNQIVASATFTYLG